MEPTTAAANTAAVNTMTAMRALKRTRMTEAMEEAVDCFQLCKGLPDSCSPCMQREGIYFSKNLSNKCMGASMGFPNSTSVKVLCAVGKWEWGVRRSVVELK